MNRDDQPRFDALDDVFDACFGTAVYLNEKSIDEALKAKLLARGHAMNDAGTTEVFNVLKDEPANQAMQKQRKTKKAA